LGEVRFPTVRPVDALAVTRDGLAAEYRLHAAHDASGVLGQHGMAARATLDLQGTEFTVIDGLQGVVAQQLGQLACVNEVTFVLLS
jgi:hypothetical protein